MPQGLVYHVKYHLHPIWQEERAPGRKKRRKGHFVLEGPNWAHSLDGHSKLMGFQDNTFPNAIYGCIDTASRKLLWAKVWSKSCDPYLIGRWYFEYLFGHGVMGTRLRFDRGPKTRTMAIRNGFWDTLWMGFPQTTGLMVSWNLYFGQMLEALHWMPIPFELVTVVKQRVWSC